MNRSEGTSLYASNEAINSDPAIVSVVVASAPTPRDASATAAWGRAALETIVGKRNRRGPGQSVPKRKPGPSHGNVTSRVNSRDHAQGMRVGRPIFGAPSCRSRAIGFEAI